MFLVYEVPDPGHIKRGWGMPPIPFRDSQRNPKFCDTTNSFIVDVTIEIQVHCVCKNIFMNILGTIGVSMGHP